MKYPIRQNKLSAEIKNKIFLGLEQHALKITGINGLSEDSISFEIYDDSDFVGAVVVQSFWEQLHIKYLFVDEKYRGKGIASHLMQHVFEFGKSRGCQFAFVETMSFQAPDFYQKLGFVIEFSRPGYAKNTSFHYLKKTLNDFVAPRKVARTGVYGVAKQEDKILLIEQRRGPYAGKYDFPGGGIEFGESAEYALRREFLEEIAMDFDEAVLLDNLTAVIDVPGTREKAPYTFYQIGLIYLVEGLHSQKCEEQAEFQHCWANLNDLHEGNCSGLLWKYVLKYRG